MPSAEELEQMLDRFGERSLVEFPDDDAWEQLKVEIEAQHEEGEHGEDR